MIEAKPVAHCFEKLLVNQDASLSRRDKDERKEK
jgi:hypothetical protein